MANTLPPVKGAAFSFEISLVSQANTDVFQTSVTLAAGDVKVSKDGGSFSNIASLPTEIGTSGVITVALSTSETNADRVAVLFHDASGSEWQDALVTIFTAAQTFDTIDTNVDSVLADTGTDGVVVASGSKTGYALTSAEHTNIADELLKRDWTSVSGEASRSVLNALRFLRNKWSLSGTTLTVCEEDDSTSAWTGTVTTNASADPVTGNDPS